MDAYPRKQKYNRPVLLSGLAAAVGLFVLWRFFVYPPPEDSPLVQKVGRCLLNVLSDF